MFPIVIEKFIVLYPQLPIFSMDSHCHVGTANSEDIAGNCIAWPKVELVTSSDNL